MANEKREPSHQLAATDHDAKRLLLAVAAGMPGVGCLTAHGVRISAGIPFGGCLLTQGVHVYEGTPLDGERLEDRVTLASVARYIDHLAFSLLGYLDDLGAAESELRDLTLQRETIREFLGLRDGPAMVRTFAGYLCTSVTGLSKERFAELADEFLEGHADA